MHFVKTQSFAWLQAKSDLIKVISEDKKLSAYVNFNPQSCHWNKPSLKVVHFALPVKAG
jgi:hypothetical protein